MKKILLLFYLLVTINQIHAQDWPVGTTWVYDQIDDGPYDPNNYLILKIIKDTVIQNQDAKVLSQFYWYATWDSTHAPIYPRRYFIKTENEKVSLWNPDSSKFELIYDFNLRPGDTVDYYIGNLSYCRNESNYVRYQIDSIHWIQTSGPLKKVFFYHRTGGNLCYVYDYIDMFEDIGSNFFFFQNFGAVDPPSGGGLVCFNNGTYHYPKDFECKLPTGLKQLAEFNPIIYPNPSTGNFSIHDLDINDYSLELYNQFGQRCLVTKDRDKIDISSLSSGIYILRLKSKLRSVSVKINKM